MKIKINKIYKRDGCLQHGDYSNISSCQTNILAIFWGIFIIFAVFQNNYVLIPLFMSEHSLRNTDLGYRKDFVIR
jgi:hypothetical protein